MKLINQEKLLKTAAAKAGMSEKTARKYRKSGKLPSQCRVVHDTPHSPPSIYIFIKASAKFINIC
jgi:hypothetical protein